MCVGRLVGWWHLVMLVGSSVFVWEFKVCIYTFDMSILVSCLFFYVSDLSVCLFTIWTESL